MTASHTLYLIRHPRPLIAPGVCYGRLDVAAEDPLPIATALRALLPADAPVWSSPLQRCRETAGAIAAARSEQPAAPKKPLSRAPSRIFQYARITVMSAAASIAGYASGQAVRRRGWYGQRFWQTCGSSPPAISIARKVRS